jgi:hypothetical protein
MTTTSPLILRTEQLYGLSQTLSTLGYDSVFDVVRIPRERFVRQHRDVLGRQGGAVYDMIIGYAHQVVHQFRHKAVTRGFNATGHGPFSTSGPDYPTQFLDTKTGWMDKAPAGAPEANDGPAAYLTYIYGRALQEEKYGDGLSMNPLKKRRPDIGNLLVDDAAINEEIPQIQLVNEVLASAIQSNQNLNDLNGVNVLLATTRYPNTLPYHYGNQQIRAAESALGVFVSDSLLAQDITLVQDSWSPQTELDVAPANDLARLQIMASRLAPEQQRIVAEPAYFGPDSDSDRQASFYNDNFGSPLKVDSFSSMEVLASRTALTVLDIEKFFCATAGGPNAFTVVRSPNYIVPDDFRRAQNAQHSGAALPSDFGAKFINAGGGPCISLAKQADDSLEVVSLTDDRMDRINRMVRLQKWLDIPFQDIDLLATSAMEAEGDGNRALLMNDSTLRMLGVFKHYQKIYGVPAKQFAAWLDVVTPFAITPEQSFLDQIFNNSDVFDTPFVVDNQDFDYTATSGSDAARVKKICAGLRLNHRQFLTFADKISAQQDDGTLSKLNCNLFVVSAFYRCASLAPVLGMSPEDFCALVDLLDQGTGTVWNQLAGRPVVCAPTKYTRFVSDVLALLRALSDVAQWLQQRRLSGTAALALVKPRR